MSLGNIFKALAPIAAGAMFGPGGAALAGSAGTAGSAIAAGAATGAGIAALSGDDPLMGAISGGMGGYGGSGIGEAMRGTATLGATATTGPNSIGIQGFGPGAYSGTAPTLTSGFKASLDKPGQFLSNLGGGSMGKGAAKLGAVGLPAIGQAMVPEYNTNPSDDPMSKYDPKRRLNLDMTTGIKNALTRDSGLRLNQPFAQFAQGGYMADRDSRDYTDDEVDYIRYGSPLGVMSLLKEYEQRLLDYESAYDRTPRGRVEGFVEEIKDIPRNIKENVEIMRGMQEGGYLETGMGDGMSDNIPSSIDGAQPVLLSENEFVVPADVVSGLGNGSSDAGAEQLYAMMDRVRKARTGTEKMGKEVNAERLMPA
jgi:hypothetical protein